MSTTHMTPCPNYSYWANSWKTLYGMLHAWGLTTQQHSNLVFLFLFPSSPIAFPLSKPSAEAVANILWREEGTSLHHSWSCVSMLACLLPQGHLQLDKHQAAPKCGAPEPDQMDERWELGVQFWGVHAEGQTYPPPVSLMNMCPLRI